MIEVFAQRLGSIADPLLMVERVVTAADGTVTYPRLATEMTTNRIPAELICRQLAMIPHSDLMFLKTALTEIRLKDRYADTRGDARLTYRLSVRKPTPDFSLVFWTPFLPLMAKLPSRVELPVFARGAAMR